MNVYCFDIHGFKSSQINFVFKSNLFSLPRNDLMVFQLSRIMKASYELNE